MIHFTSQAEWALKRLTSRDAEHRGSSAFGGLRGRHQATSARTIDANTLIDFCSIAEYFTIARLTAVVPGVTAQELSNWELRKNAWLKYAGLDLDSYTGWASFRGFVEVRNAIAHGDGRLTDQQLGKHKDQILRFIHASSVELNGDHLRFMPKDVDKCGQVCTSFIRWLDGAAPAP